MTYKLEILCFNMASCITAQQYGAHRIELCDNPAEGGTTASIGFIKMAREKLHIELYPMIRPRGGDFLYSDEEYEIMKNDIKICKDLGCDGVVLGIMNVDGTINKKQAGKLVDIAYPLGVTFHRAFDHAINPFEALENIIEIGCERLLTSGHKTTAMDGINLINELVRQSDERIIVMPGAGIRASNIANVAQQTGTYEFHSSAKKPLSSKMVYINKDINDTISQVMTDEEEIRMMMIALNNYFKNLHEA